MKIGVSAVDIDGARRNLEAEIPHWDFKAVRSGAKKLWNGELGKIDVDGGTDAQKTTFYTSLYHSMIAPNLYVDVDGRYRGRDLEIHTADGFDYYTVFSLWDTYRATHPLFTIIERERTVDFIETMLAQYEQGGMLPVWELSANETGTMIGYHSVPVIADAWAKGIRRFDPARALKAMKHSADQDHLGLKYYRKYGFIPAGIEGASVSRTLEYAYDDWCIAQFAKSIGEKADYERFIRRAQGYRHLFDPSTGFMRPRINGGWLSPFDPSEINFHYTEANAWQYTFYVPQDVEGLIGMMGGREAFAAKLDELFTASSETSGLEQPDVSGLIGQYAHGNEPSQHMAYLYNFAGMPWKTQERVRQIMNTMYSAGPDGLCGNEDCGQMSSWYVLSALGFYPVTPGSDIYIIGSPLFERAEIRLENGKTFRVTARGLSKDNVYIQGAALKGRPYSKSYIRHEDIMSGGELAFEMGPSAGSPWGTASADLPPSRIEAHPVLPAPYLDPAPYSFSGSLEVRMGCADPEAEIRYTTDGKGAVGEIERIQEAAEDQPARADQDDRPEEGDGAEPGRRHEVRDDPRRHLARAALRIQLDVHRRRRQCPYRQGARRGQFQDGDVAGVPGDRPRGRRRPRQDAEGQKRGGRIPSGDGIVDLPARIGGVRRLEGRDEVRDRGCPHTCHTAGPRGLRNEGFPEDGNQQEGAVYKDEGEKHRHLPRMAPRCRAPGLDIRRRDHG